MVLTWRHPWMVIITILSCFISSALQLWTPLLLGQAVDSEETLSFSVLAGVRSMNEVFPLEKVDEAYERMMSGKARFRAVLTMGS
jgi:D-arabinose 1-dehydrogenase-like Zn-dependent alcohol dehydrogenase